MNFRSSPGPDGTGLLITNEVNIKQMNNQELIMRINSGVQSGDLFFTDLNGFQMVIIIFSKFLLALFVKF